MGAALKDTIANLFKHYSFQGDCATATISTGESTITIDVEFGALQLLVTFKGYVNADTLDQEENVASTNMHVPAYAEVLQSFDSIRQFLCAHVGTADLLPDVAVHIFLPLLRSCAQVSGGLGTHNYPCCISCFAGAMIFFLFVFLNEVSLICTRSCNSSFFE